MLSPSCVAPSLDGEFVIEEPLSPAMKAFLSKHDTKSNIGKRPSALLKKRGNERSSPSRRSNSHIHDNIPVPKWIGFVADRCPWSYFIVVIDHSGHASLHFPEHDLAAKLGHRSSRSHRQRCTVSLVEEFDRSASERTSARGFSGPRSGACCFRPISLQDLGLQCESLKWIWLHPYFRKSGILSELWPVLRENHGDFHLEEPISPAMKSFLSKLL